VGGGLFGGETETRLHAANNKTAPVAEPGAKNRMASLYYYGKQLAAIAREILEEARLCYQK
jgi:hypothetical protein